MHRNHIVDGHDAARPGEGNTHFWIGRSSARRADIRGVFNVEERWNLRLIDKPHRVLIEQAVALNGGRRAAIHHRGRRCRCLRAPMRPNRRRNSNGRDHVRAARATAGRCGRGTSKMPASGDQFPDPSRRPSSSRRETSGRDRPVLCERIHVAHALQRACATKFTRVIQHGHVDALDVVGH